MTGDPPAQPSLARSTMVQAVGTVLSRVTGFGKWFALAYALGADRLADTYLLANNTPNILYELVLGGVLSGTVLPVFVKALRREEAETGSSEGWQAISAVCTVALVAAALLAGAFVFVAPLFIRLYTLRTGAEVGADQIRVATQLLRLFAPQVFLYAVVSLSTALLGARRRFAAPKFAPILNNLVVIALFLAYPSLAGHRSLDAVQDDRSAILLLGLGTTFGVAAMAAGQLPLRDLRYHLRWNWAPRHPAVRTIVALSGWTVGFVAANQVALFAVNVLANRRAGDVTSYFLAYTMFLLPHGVVSVSIITALQPELADRWAEHDLAGFRRVVGTGIRSIGALLIPAAVGYALLARPLVALLLEHGAMEADAADRLAGTLQLMALGLPAFSGWLFMTACYQAMQNTKSLFFLYLAENGTNIAAAVALYPILQVQGLGLAFAIAYSVALGVAFADLRRRTGGLADGVKGSIAKTCAASGVMALAVWVCTRLLPGVSDAGPPLEVGVGLVSGVTVYVAGAYLLRIDGVHDLLVFRRRG